MRLDFLLFLASCLQADAYPPTPAPKNPDAALSAEAFAALVSDGAQGTTRGVRVARERIDALQVPDRLEARRAASLVIGNCPWNRAGVQLPIALALVAARHDAAPMDAAVRTEWRRIQLGLAEHVALLDQFGVTGLRAPLPGEFLATHPDVIVTRAQLDAAADPLAVTRPLVDQIPDLVERYDLATREFIEMDSLQLRGHTAAEWPYPHLLDGWRAALAALEPQLRDEALLTDVRAVIALLDAYSQTRC